MTKKTLRRIFSDYKKSTECKIIETKLLRKQLNICPITKTKLNLTSDCHLSHIISIKKLEELREINEVLAISLVTDSRNLFLEEGTSNKKRSSKVCKEMLDDLLESIQFSEEELSIITS